MNSYIVDWIKNRDYFGHDIKLRIRNKARPHNSIFGGVISTLVSGFLTYYIFTLVMKMITFDDDRLSSNKERLNHSIGYDFKYTDMNIIFQYQLNNRVSGRVIEFTDEVR